MKIGREENLSLGQVTSEPDVRNVPKLNQPVICQRSNHFKFLPQIEQSILDLRGLIPCGISFSQDNFLIASLISVQKSNEHLVNKVD